MLTANSGTPSNGLFGTSKAISLGANSGTNLKADVDVFVIIRNEASLKVQLGDSLLGLVPPSRRGAVCSSRYL